MNFYLDDFYTSKEQSEQFKQYRDTVLKLVLNHVGKIKERISTIDSKIADCTNAEKYRLYGELITSNLPLSSDGRANQWSRHPIEEPVP